MTTPSYQARVRGSLVAGAVGDALGAPVEFRSLESIRSEFGNDGIREFVPAYGRTGVVTDDTQMTLFTAEGLVLAAQAGTAGRRSDLVRSVHRAYLRWLRTQGESSRHPTFTRPSLGWLFDLPELHERRAPGNTCVGALRLDRMGRVEQPLNHSKGCGGVMRVAPVGLALGIDDPFRVGCEVAALTHGHPTGTLAAGLLAAAIREIVQGASVVEACVEAASELPRWADYVECQRAVEHALDLAERREPSPEDVERLGEGWVAEEALAIAIYCAAVSPDLECALRLAVNHGGDSDSTGSITGNLLGAALGEEAIPGRWLEDLELLAIIRHTADEICAACERSSIRSDAG